MSITDQQRKDNRMSTLPGQEGWSSNYPAKPVETPEAIVQRIVDEGNVCGGCGDWITGGADPEVMAQHLCEPEPEEGVGLADTQTGQGVL